MLQQHAVSETYRVGITSTALSANIHKPKEQDTFDHEGAIKLLSQQTGMPLDQVRETYHANLKRLSPR